MDVYTLVAFVALLAATVGAGLIVLDHYLETRMMKKTGEIICNDVIPTMEKALEDYTGTLLEQTKKMTEDMVENFKNLI